MNPPTNPGTNPTERSHSVARSSLLVSSFTMLSRVSGLVRDIVVATIFGASPAADAFFVAFKIPNFFRRLFAEGAFASGFVPVMARWRREQPEALKHLINHVAGALGAVLLIVTLLGVVGAPWVTLIFAPGYWDDPEQLQLTSDLLRFTFPYLLLISLTALCGSVLNTFSRFGVPAFTPVLLNVCLIFGALVLSPLLAEPIMGVAIAVLLAGLTQLLFQFYPLARIGLLPTPRVNFADPGVKQVWTLMLPAIFGASVAQINLMLDTWFASRLEHSAISWLYYADRVVELPVGVFAIGLATVMLPRLSALYAAGDLHRFGDNLIWALRLGLLVSIPATTALVLLAEPIVATLFGYGAFDARDVDRSSAALIAYSVGLLGFVLVKLLAPGYFARHDTKTPVRIGIVAVGVNLVLNIAFMNYLGHVGLALATSIASLVNTVLLWRGLAKADVLKRNLWSGLLWRIALAAAAMGAALYLSAGMFDWLSLSALARALHLTWICAAGAAVYAGVLLLLGVRPRQFASPR